MDHSGPGAGSTGPPRRRGVVQTESARNRLKRTLRGSDRRSAEVGSGVDQWTTPRRIFLVGGWTGPRWLAEGRRPTTPQRAGAVGECGGDDDTYFKKEKRVVQWSSPARPPRMAPQSGAIALSGDLRSPTSGPPPLVQCCYIPSYLAGLSPLSLHSVGLRGVLIDDDVLVNTD